MFKLLYIELTLMESCSHKLDKIKNTIEEIKDDIEKMKVVRKLLYIYLIIFIEKRNNFKQNDGFYECKCSNYG